MHLLATLGNYCCNFFKKEELLFCALKVVELLKYLQGKNSNILNSDEVFYVRKQNKNTVNVQDLCN
jgi:hypothetical protein